MFSLRTCVIAAARGSVRGQRWFKTFSRKGTQSVRHNPFLGVHPPTEKELNKVLVPRRNSSDAEVSWNKPANDVEVDIRYVGVGYRPTVVMKAVLIARDVARKGVPAVSVHD